MVGNICNQKVKLGQNHLVYLHSIIMNQWKLNLLAFYQVLVITCLRCTKGYNGTTRDYNHMSLVSPNVDPRVQTLF